MTLLISANNALSTKPPNPRYSRPSVSHPTGTGNACPTFVRSRRTAQDRAATIPRHHGQPRRHRTVFAESQDREHHQPVASERVRGRAPPSPHEDWSNRRSAPIMRSEIFGLSTSNSDCRPEWTRRSCRPTTPSRTGTVAACSRRPLPSADVYPAAGPRLRPQRPVLPGATSHLQQPEGKKKAAAKPIADLDAADEVEPGKPGEGDFALLDTLPYLTLNLCQREPLR